MVQTSTAFFSGELGGLVLYALYGLLTQNAVLGRALGSSRLTLLVNDEDGSTGTFAQLLFLTQLLSGFLCWGINRWMNEHTSENFRAHFRVLFLMLGLCIVFFLLFCLIVELMPSEKARATVRQLPIAAFNCCIMGTLLLTGVQSYTLSQTVGFCIGSSLGYLVALGLLTEGNRKMKKADLPVSFRGLPATLVYLGILSLLVYSFTGHGLAV